MLWKPDLALVSKESYFVVMPSFFTWFRLCDDLSAEDGMIAD